MTSMKSDLLLGSPSSLLVVCSSTQLPTRVSNSLATRFINFTCPSKSIHPRNGIRSKITGTPDAYMNSLIIFPIRSASSSFSPLSWLQKYFFPAITLVIIFRVRLLIHSLITTLAFVVVVVVVLVGLAKSVQIFKQNVHFGGSHFLK